MLLSVINSNTTLSLLIVFINQSDYKLSKINQSKNTSIVEIKSMKVSLSEARNLGLHYIFNNNIKFRFIMFPDDDTKFDISFFNNFKGLKNINYLIDIKCDDTNKHYLKHNYKHGEEVRIHSSEAVSSTNMIITFDTIKNVGFFDERLGVGALYGAGEDMDYFIRCTKYTGKNFIYISSLYIFHPDFLFKYQNMSLKQILTRFYKYGNGVIFMFCKHGMYFRALLISIRAAGGFVLNIFKLRWKIALCYFLVVFSRFYLLMKCFFYNIFGGIREIK